MRRLTATLFGATALFALGSPGLAVNAQTTDQQSQSDARHAGMENHQDAAEQNTKKAGAYDENHQDAAERNLQKKKAYLQNHHKAAERNAQKKGAYDENHQDAVQADRAAADRQRDKPPQ